LKIAIIRFSALGDLASLSPILKSLKYKPTIITTSIGYEYYKDEFDDFIILENKSILSVSKLIWKIRKNKFDIIFDFQCNDRSRLISNFLNSKIFDNKNIDVYKNSTFAIFQSIVLKTDLLKPINFNFTEKEKNFIVLNCGSSENWLSKRLPFNKWREISIFLNKKFNLPMYLTGDKSEVKYLEELSLHLEGDIKILAGKTNLLELKSILKNAYLTISTDSAAMHISATQGTPTIGIFGATNWVRSAPFGPWSTVVYDKVFYHEGIPSKINLKEITNCYENINIEPAIKSLNNYLN